MKKWEYRKGLHDLGNGIYAYLQPDGSWGWSNAGLIADGEESILIDTLTDLLLTGEMLAAMDMATKSASVIDKLIITHANPDQFKCGGKLRIVHGQLPQGQAMDFPDSAVADDGDSDFLHSLSSSRDQVTLVAAVQIRSLFKGTLERFHGCGDPPGSRLEPPAGSFTIRTFEQGRGVLPHSHARLHKAS